MATTSMQSAKNDRDAQVAMAAAESGMAFIQRTISDVVMKQGQATGQAAMDAIYNRLQTLNGTATLGGQSIGPPQQHDDHHSHHHSACRSEARPAV